MPRADVSMSPERIRDLLASARTAILSTLGSDGFPHSVAMWFVAHESTISMWTYAKSAKARNLARDSRCSVLLEQGERYDELAGVLVRGCAELVRSPQEVAEIGRAIVGRYSALSLLPPSLTTSESIARQAAKRIGIQIPMARLTSWDHSRLD